MTPPFTRHLSPRPSIYRFGLVFIASDRYLPPRPGISRLSLTDFQRVEPLEPRGCLVEHAVTVDGGSAEVALHQVFQRPQGQFQGDVVEVVVLLRRMIPAEKTERTSRQQAAAAAAVVVLVYSLQTSSDGCSLAVLMGPGGSDGTWRDHIAAPHFLQRRFDGAEDP